MLNHGRNIKEITVRYVCQALEWYLCVRNLDSGQDDTKMEERNYIAVYNHTKSIKLLAFFYYDTEKHFL